jgi:hypothetical protein
VQRANAKIAATDSPVEPLPEAISPHGLRHTYASLLFEADNTPIYVMAQLGHTDPKFTIASTPTKCGRGPTPGSASTRSSEALIGRKRAHNRERGSERGV